MILSPPGRVLLLAGLLALGLAACGRKGALESPPDPSVAPPPGQGQTGRPGARGAAADGPSTGGRGSAAGVRTSPTSSGRAASTAEDGEDAESSYLPGFLNQPSQTSSPLRRRPYKVPKEPFILDPLL